MRKAIRSFVGVPGLLIALAGTSLAGMEAPIVVRAAADGSFHYSWRFVADEALVSGGYHWFGIQNVTGGLFADCFCDPLYCSMIPGDEVEVFVSGTLTNLAQDGVVENFFSDCSSGFVKNTRIVSPTTDVGGPAAVSLRLWAVPNPCREAVQVHYSLPTEDRVRITVQDVSGRRVATLRDGVESAGPHALSWSVRGDAGKLPPAVYFAAIEFRGQTRMQRILVLQ